MSKTRSRHSRHSRHSRNYRKKRHIRHTKRRVGRTRHKSHRRHRKRSRRNKRGGSNFDNMITMVKTEKAQQEQQKDVEEHVKREEEREEKMKMLKRRQKEKKRQAAEDWKEERIRVELLKTTNRHLNTEIDKISDLAKLTPDKTYKELRQYINIYKGNRIASFFDKLKLQLERDPSVTLSNAAMEADLSPIMTGFEEATARQLDTEIAKISNLAELTPDKTYKKLRQYIQHTYKGNRLASFFDKLKSHLLGNPSIKLRKAAKNVAKIMKEEEGSSDEESSDEESSE